ncbi:small serum protein 1-like [Polypterus senegalus]|uniref:small serum protein 1-like n=1 Tax=Polypterus senegalus TaxID=55291 RepID=UPI00196503FF|nr:small serum protein 1-like [Polypterus senegalus]
MFLAWILVFSFLGISHSEICIAGQSQMVVTEDGRYVTPTYCTDPFGETIYQSGEKWRTSNCMDCSCEMGGFECCETKIDVPQNIPDDCMMEFDRNECKYWIFKMDNRSTPC